MPDLKESEQLNKLYSMYGVAAHNCCNMEYRLANILLGPKWTEAEEITAEKVTEIYDRLEKSTLGSLLKEYKQHVTLTAEQLALAEEVLEKRNYLTHRFFGKYGNKMCDPSIQKQMISELEGLILVFQSVSRSLDPETWSK